MTDTTERIRGFLSPEIWTFELTDVLGRVQTDAQGRLLLAIIRSLQSLHVGITFDLAAGLARTLLSQAQDVPSPWNVVYDRLKQELAGVSGMNLTFAQGAFAHEIALHRSVQYTLFRLVMPLVSAGCRKLSPPGAILFSEDNEDATITVDEYHQYGKELHDFIVLAATSGVPELHTLFWQDRALTLAGLARPQTSPSPERLPQIELPHTGLLLRLQPDMEYANDDPTRRLQLTQQRILFDPHRSEAGAAGAYLTRQIEELPRMLQTEFTYPEIIRLDRLLNTGFMAMKRPPIPIKRRDVLIVGIFTPSVLGTPGGMFMKACWLDCLVRLSRLLNASDLSRSELRVIEGDPFSRFRTHSMILRDLPERLRRADVGVDSILRHQFFTAAGWFPAYLDRRGTNMTYAANYRREESAGRSPSEDLKTWVRAVWADQKDHQRWLDDPARQGQRRRSVAASPAQGFSNLPLALDQFAYIFRMLFLPTDLLDPTDENAYLGTEWRNLFALETGSAGVTWVPQGLNEAGWQFAGNSFNSPTWFDDAETLNLDQRAGLFVKAWLDEIGEEMERA